MGKSVPLGGPVLAWARDRFARYYGAAVVPAPPGLLRREFAAFPFAEETVMRRHDAFGGAEEFKRFLPREVPRHVYYSSAYYEHPAAPTMAGKDWLGADLIFDLDADHLRDAGTLSYVEQLERVRERTVALYDDFLLGDLGVDPTDTQLVFSGGRGYHVHVRDPAFRSLTSPERREIVDYILGVGVDPARVLRSPIRAPGGEVVAISGEAPAEERTGRRGRARAPAPLALPAEGAGGWPGRISRSLEASLRRWETLGTEGTARELVERWGLPKPRAQALARTLIDRHKARAILDGRTLDVFPDRPPEDLLHAVLQRATIEVQGETDAPVTTDIHRLIRLPGSLHGGTGFRVVALPRERLDRFDPFREAVPFVGGGSTTVRFRAEVDYPFEPTVAGRPGEEQLLPDPVALFLTLRGEAEPRDVPGR